MKLVFAFECFADEDIWHILVNECGLPLRKRHSESKGRVATDTLRNFRAHLGLVDQDPGAVAPETLQQAKRVQFEGDVELRTLRDHHVLILHPRLEDCFMKGMRGVGLRSQLARTADELHRVLGTPSAYRHNLFREELRTLRTQAKRKRIPVFLIDLEKIVRRLVTQR